MGNDSTLGQLLRQHRSEQGASQEQVAAGLCSSAYISQVERDLRVPTAELLAQLVDRLQTPLDLCVEPYLAAQPGIQQEFVLCTELAKRGHIEAAERVLEHVRERTAASARPDLLRGDLLEAEAMLRYHQGLYDTSLELLKEALEEREKSRSRLYKLVRTYHNTATVLRDSGDRTRAGELLIQAFCKARHLDPYESRQRTERVVDLIEEVITDLSFLLLNDAACSDIWLVFEIMECSWKEEELLGPLPAEFRASKAAAEVKSGRVVQAEKVLNLLCAQDDLPSPIAEYCRHLNGILRRLRGDYQAAYEQQRCVLESLDCSSNSIRLMVQNELALCSLRLNNPERACDWLHQAEAVDVDDSTNAGVAETYLLLARAFRMQGDYKRAQRYVQQGKNTRGQASSLKRLLLVEELKLCLEQENRERALEILDELQRELEEPLLFLGPE
jgi:tetratricopeptide (TPR) repeat protein